MTVKFSAEIDCDDADIVLGLFQTWLDRSDISVRDKMSGEQISVSDPRLALECFRSFGASGYGDSFLVEGTLSDQVADPRSFLHGLNQACAAQSIGIRLESAGLAARG